MNNLFKISGILFIMTLFMGCDIRDGEDPCEGEVRINLYAERFQNRSEDPLFEREALFCSRIMHIRYYLYYEGMLKEQGIVDKFDDEGIGFYTQTFDNLDYGNYNVVFVSNCTRNALTGDPSIADNLVLTYPGTLDTEDYFTAVFPFTVDSENLHEYTVGLSRAHGVVRYTFNNLPEDAVAVGVTMENVGLQKWVTADYMDTFAADMRYAMIPVSRQIDTDEYIMGTFPTVRNERSRLHVGLYRQDDERAYLSQMISDTLTVRRNQLLDIAITYENGTFTHEIILDSSWNGSNSGGEIIIQ